MGRDCLAPSERFDRPSVDVKRRNLQQWQRLEVASARRYRRTSACADECVRPRTRKRTPSRMASEPRAARRSAVSDFPLRGRRASRYSSVDRATTAKLSCRAAWVPILPTTEVVVSLIEDVESREAARSAPTGVSRPPPHVSTTPAAGSPHSLPSARAESPTSLAGVSPAGFNC